jgi:hypothetical protein
LVCLKIEECRAETEGTGWCRQMETFWVPTFLEHLWQHFRLLEWAEAKSPGRRPNLANQRKKNQRLIRDFVKKSVKEMTA